MNFQKTLLAATLAVVGFSANAAGVLVQQFGLKDTATSGSPDYIYQIGDNFYFKTTDASGTKYEYTPATEAELANYLTGPENVIRGGVLETTKGDANTQESPLELVDGNGYESVYNDVWESEINTDALQDTLTGTITNEKDGSEESMDGIVNIAPQDVVRQTVFNQVGAGIASFANTATGIQQQGTDVGSFVTQNTLIDGVWTNAQGSTLTSQGLGFYDLSAEDLTNVDFSYDSTTGTLTTKNVTQAETSKEDLLVEVRQDGDKRLVQIAGKDTFTVDANGKLTPYAGEFKGELIAGGAGKSVTNGSTETKTKTTYVGANQTIYGESSEKTVADGTVYTLGETNADGSGLKQEQVFYTGDKAQTVKKAQSLTSGIIAQDAAGENVYGLTVAKTETGKADQQTTVTAEGITTTGDVTFVDATTGTATSFKNTVSRLNSRVNEVEETAYRGIAIALAAQQQVPNIGAGQFAVFGGVGHYEGESAVALGLANVLENGRTSFSAAVGTAGNGEVGGRVGMAYVFGGK